VVRNIHINAGDATTVVAISASLRGGFCRLLKRGGMRHDCSRQPSILLRDMFDCCWYIRGFAGVVEGGTPGVMGWVKISASYPIAGRNMAL